MNKQERKNRIYPNETPKYVRCYDNGGETADRYTVVFTGRYTHKTSGEHWHLGMSSNPFSPLGIGSHGSSRTQIDKPGYAHLGKKIRFEDLTDECRKCVEQTYLYLWDFADENGNPL
jgi:hypothetical protein